MHVVKCAGYKWDVIREPQGWVASQRGGAGMIVTTPYQDDLPKAIAEECKGKSIRARSRVKPAPFRRRPVDFSKLAPWLAKNFPGATCLNYTIEGKTLGDSEIILTLTMDAIPEGTKLNGYIPKSVRQTRISWIDAECENLLQEDKATA